MARCTAGSAFRRHVERPASCCLAVLWQLAARLLPGIVLGLLGLLLLLLLLLLLRLNQLCDRH